MKQFSKTNDNDLQILYKSIIRISRNNMWNCIFSKWILHDNARNFVMST